MLVASKGINRLAACVHNWPHACTTVARMHTTRTYIPCNTYKCVEALGLQPYTANTVASITSGIGFGKGKHGSLITWPFRLPRPNGHPPGPDPLSVSPLLGPRRALVAMQPQQMRLYCNRRVGCCPRANDAFENGTYLVSAIQLPKLDGFVTSTVCP